MKSECNEYREKISAFVLGELSGEESRELEAHLALCSLCSSERDRYAQTMGSLASAGDEEVPRHFFVSSEKESPGPWQLFRQMRFRWQAAFAGAALLLLLSSVAAFSRFQVRSGPDGWAMGFGSSDVDVPALKKVLLEAVEQKDQEAKTAWIQAVRSEILRLQSDQKVDQKEQFAKALASIDSRVSGRVDRSEGQLREDTQRLVAALYRTVAHQRAQDLAAINLRFEATDVRNAVKAQQTEEVLGTLLQIADTNIQ